MSLSSHLLHGRKLNTPNWGTAYGVNECLHFFALTLMPYMYGIKFFFSVQYYVNFMT